MKKSGFDILRALLKPVTAERRAEIVLESIGPNSRGELPDIEPPDDQSSTMENMGASKHR